MRSSDTSLLILKNMFFFLIAFAAALLTIFGFSSSRNSLRNFSSRGLNQLIQQAFGTFSYRDEFANQRVLDEIGGGEERLMKADGVIAEKTTEIIENVGKASEEKPVRSESTESFTFDYKTRRHDFSRTTAEDRSSSSGRERNNVLVPQDMWNILKKTSVPASERKNAETLFEALLQETLRESRRLRGDDKLDNTSFNNKTQIIGEVTFEKMMEAQSQNEDQDRKDHLRIE